MPSKKKKKKKCEKCGDALDGNGIQGYCSTCYEKIWDNGFESTTQHAEELADEEEKRN
jgi:hypothetical protein